MTAVTGYYVILENVFGLMGACLRSFQLSPQVYKNWRNKSTKGLAQSMFFLWMASSAILGIYSIVLNLSIPLMIQPQMFALLSLFIYIQCFYYDSPKLKGNKIKTGALFVLMMILITGCEVGAIYGIRYANARNVRWPENVAGFGSIVLVITGYVPQFVTIYQDKRVTGISFVFMALDMAGVLFAVISLAFRPPPFDTLASIVFISIFTLDSLIIFLYHILNRYHARKESAIQNHNEEGVVTDDVEHGRR